MKCGSCNLTDGKCYTSNPPQVKCIVTNKFHYYNDECTAFNIEEVTPIETSCIVCGEAIQLYYDESPIKICDKCKQAILYMRNIYENKNLIEENKCKDNIIEYLLDMLEGELIGLKSSAIEEIKDKFDVDLK